jgi:hypothetical protein
MYLYVNILQKFIQNLMNSLWDIRIFLGLVPKESTCITEDDTFRPHFLDVLGPSYLKENIEKITVQRNTFRIHF